MRIFMRPVIGHIDAAGQRKTLDKALILLSEVEVSGNLRAASATLGISYRHAWNL